MAFRQLHKYVTGPPVRAASFHPPLAVPLLDAFPALVRGAGGLVFGLETLEGEAVLLGEGGVGEEAAHGVGVDIREGDVVLVGVVDLGVADLGHFPALNQKRVSPGF